MFQFLFSLAVYPVIIFSTVIIVIFLTSFIIHKDIVPWCWHYCYISLDINECAENIDECSDYGECIDIEPKQGQTGYRCQCKPGFDGDGFTCSGM